MTKFLQLVGLVLVFAGAVAFSSEPGFNGKDVIALLAMILAVLVWIELRSRAYYNERNDDE